VRPPRTSRSSGNRRAGLKSYHHALLEAGSGRGSRLSSPEAHFSVAPRGAEASTVGVYRAELHKRALQWERTTAYLEPSKACGGAVERSAGEKEKGWRDWFNPCVNSVGADNSAITVIWLLKLTSLCFNMN
jgi:hypothetical protein